MNGHLAQKEGDGRDGLSRIYVIQQRPMGSKIITASASFSAIVLNRNDNYVIYGIISSENWVWYFSDGIENSLRKAENGDEEMTTPKNEEGAVSLFCIAGILSWPGWKCAPFKRNAGFSRWEDG